jgi:hypothetical protein
VSPQFNGDTQSSIFLGAGTGTANDLIQMFGKTIQLIAANGVSVSNGPLTVAGAVTLSSTLSIGGTATYHGRTLTNSTSGTNQAGPPVPDVTTSATYGLVNDSAGLGSAVGITFVKDEAATRIKVQLHTGSFCTAVASTGVRWGVRDVSSGITVDVAQMFFNNASVHGMVSGVNYLTGVGAGTWVLCPVWRRYIGTGNISRDVNDWMSMEAEECV